MSARQPANSSSLEVDPYGFYTYPWDDPDGVVSDSSSIDSPEVEESQGSASDDEQPQVEWPPALSKDEIREQLRACITCVDEGHIACDVHTLCQLVYSVVRPQDQQWAQGYTVENINIGIKYLNE